MPYGTSTDIDKDAENACYICMLAIKLLGELYEEVVHEALDRSISKEDFFKEQKSTLKF